MPSHNRSCPLCASSSSIRRDWPSFLRQLPEADRERLLMAAASTRGGREIPVRVARLEIDEDGKAAFVRERSEGGR